MEITVPCGECGNVLTFDKSGLEDVLALMFERIEQENEKLRKGIERIIEEPNKIVAPIDLPYPEGQSHVKDQLRELLKPCKGDS